MNKRKHAKLLVQALAMTFGILGLFWVGVGLYSIITGIRDSDWHVILFMAPMLILGGIVLVVTWQNLRHFGPNAIKNVVFLVVFTLCIILAPFDKPFGLGDSILINSFLQLAQFLVPIIIAGLVYSYLAKKLIQIICCNNQHGD